MGGTLWSPHSLCRDCLEYKSVHAFACCHSRWEFTCELALPCPGHGLSLKLFTITASYNVLPPLLSSKAWLFREECHRDSKASHSVSIVQSRLSLLITIYQNEKHFWWVLNNALIYGSSNTSLGVLLLLCTLNSVSYLVLDSGLINSVGVLSHRRALNWIKKSLIIP